MKSLLESAIPLLEEKGVFENLRNYLFTINEEQLLLEDKGHVYSAVDFYLDALDSTVIEVQAFSCLASYMLANNQQNHPFFYNSQKNFLEKLFLISISSSSFSSSFSQKACLKFPKNIFSTASKSSLFSLKFKSILKIVEKQIPVSNVFPLKDLLTKFEILYSKLK